MNSILTFIEILDMQLDDLANRIIEHKKAWSFLDRWGWFCDVDQVENGSQNLIHALNILYFRI